MITRKHTFQIKRAQDSRGGRYHVFSPPAQWNYSQKNQIEFNQRKTPLVEELTHQAFWVYPPCGVFGGRKYVEEQD